MIVHGSNGSPQSVYDEIETDQGWMIIPQGRQRRGHPGPLSHRIPDNTGVQAAAVSVDNQLSASGWSLQPAGKSGDHTRRWEFYSQPRACRKPAGGSRCPFTFRLPAATSGPVYDVPGSFSAQLYPAGAPPAVFFLEPTSWHYSQLSQNLWITVAFFEREGFIIVECGRYVRRYICIRRYCFVRLHGRHWLVLPYLRRTRPGCSR